MVQHPTQSSDSHLPACVEIPPSEAGKSASKPDKACLKNHPAHLAWHYLQRLQVSSSKIFVILQTTSRRTWRQLSQSQFFCQVMEEVRPLKMQLVGLSFLAFCGGTGIASFLWLTTMPPLPDCQRLSASATDSNKLLCAEQAARQGEEAALVQGLALVKNWSDHHPLNPRSRQLLQELSQAVLTIARNKIMAEEDLDGAIALAQQIPSHSPLYQEAQTDLQTWKQYRDRIQQNQQQLAPILQAKDWKAASKFLQTLDQADTPFGRQQFYQLRQKVITERVADDQLQPIRQLVANPSSTAEQISQALVLIQDIPSGTLAFDELKTIQPQLQQQLFSRLTGRLQQGDVSGAIADVRFLPDHLILPPELRDLVWVNRAQSLVSQSLPDQPFYWLLAQLWLSRTQMQQRLTNPVLANQAQALIPQLEQRIQDLTQLQFASAVASMHHIPAFQVAIQMAQGVALGRPYRLLAQTLIADWRLDIQKAEDQPYLIAAQNHAQHSTIPQLQAAIALASQVQPQRPLRTVAQALIFRWTRQIQTFEDQPKLDQALALAKQNKLEEAIQAVNQIQAGRALYEQAQGLSQQWIRQIQIAADRPILDEAHGLANRGRLSAAIGVASSIGSGRALYREAQAAIARWAAERQALIQAEAIEATESPAPSDPQSEAEPPAVPGPSAEQSAPAANPEATPELPPP